MAKYKNWKKIAYDALVNLNGKADVKDIYKEVARQIGVDSLTEGNKSAIRTAMQRCSSDCKRYAHSEDLFSNPESGVWSLKDNNQKPIEYDVASHNVWGMHIKERNNCLSPDNNHICIGWVYLGNLKGKSAQDIEDIYDSNNPNATASERGQDLSQIKNFVLDMNIGDYVVYSKSNEGISIGEVTSDYYFDDKNPDQFEHYVHNRKVKWLKTNLPRDDFDQNLKNSIGTAKTIFSLNKYKDDIKAILEDSYVKDDSNDASSEVVNQNNRATGGVNQLYYGIPGCGKSYKIKCMLECDPANNRYTEFEEAAKELNLSYPVDEENIFRTTFYLDYTYSDFVGQVVPTTEQVADSNKQEVFYKTVAGPFTKALTQAFRTDKPVYLIIEEINRGNAAAIFGDIFQLLDRYNEEKDGHKVGDSLYQINNDFIEKYLKDNGVNNLSKIYIPSNLNILATMNTSDQSVFPLDTAFKRRWDRIRVTPEWNREIDLFDMCVPFTKTTWRTFGQKVNSKLRNQDGLILEDKQLGPFFIGKECLISQNEIDNLDENTPESIEKFKTEANRKLAKFVNNVIDYLFNDVTKFDHSILFKAELGYDDLYDLILKDKAQCTQLHSDPNYYLGSDFGFKKGIFDENAYLSFDVELLEKLYPKLTENLSNEDPSSESDK